MEQVKYAGLRIEDEAALLDAKAKGAEWVARDQNGQLMCYSVKPVKNTSIRSGMGMWIYENTTPFLFLINDNKLKFIQWSDPEPVNIAAAIAQIKARSAATEIPVSGKPLTWNERINLMTAGEKAAFSMNEWCQMHNEAANYAWEQPEAVSERFKERMTELLNSPCEGVEKG